MKKNEPAPIIACGYIRVSTQEQVQKGVSLETQRAEIEAYCQQKGLTLMGFYEDRGISARKSLAKRESFMRMMADVQAKKINHIVVLRLDRFFRNVYEYHKMMQEYLEPNHCAWSAVREDYDTSTTNGRLMINLRLAIAEQECDQDSDRIKDVFANRIRDGYAVSWNAPLGYSVVDKRYVPNEQAEIVRDVFQTFLVTDSVSKTMIAVREKHGFPLLYMKVKTILSSEIYTGKRRDNDHYCEPLIDRETFDRVQEKLKDNMRFRPSGHEFTFSGLVRCHVCGSCMAGTYDCSDGVHEYKYYRCNHASVSRICPNRKRINEQIIENYLVGKAMLTLKDYAFSVTEQKKELPTAGGNREQIQGRIDRVVQLYIDGIITHDEMLTRKGEFESQIVDVPEERKDIGEGKVLLDGDFREIYKDLSVSERNHLWRSVIKRIEVEDGKVADIVFL